MPAAHGWNVVRQIGEESAWDVQPVMTLDEAVPLLNGTQELVLGLPLTAVLAQRLRLPTVESEDFTGMVRLQIEKALPYSPEEVTTDFEIIEQTEEGSVVSAIAVHNAKLSELAAPLLANNYIPTQVTVYAAQRIATHAAGGHAFLIYREDEALVCAISEDGKLGFTRSLDGADAGQLQRNLPEVAFSAEVQGIDTSFPVVLLDEGLLELQETVQGLFVSRADLIGVETPPAATKLNLLPDDWRRRRAELVRQAEWKKRAVWIGGAYAALLLLFALYLGFVEVRIHLLENSVSRDAPATAFIKKTETKWKALSPAIDPHYYPIELLYNLSESLPKDVQITQFNQSARQVAVDGEANSAALAYQFAEKVKKNSELKAYQFEMAAPRLLPNNHAQFRLEGKPK